MIQFPAQPCDCGRNTVHVVEGVRRCLACQEVERQRAATWIGHRPIYQMEKIVQLAILRLEARDKKDGQGHLTSVSCLEIVAAFKADAELKQAMNLKRREEYLATNPFISKDTLAND